MFLHNCRKKTSNTCHCSVNRPMEDGCLLVMGMTLHRRRYGVFPAASAKFLDVEIGLGCGNNDGWSDVGMDDGELCQISLRS